MRNYVESGWKRAGWFLYIFVPMVAYLVLNILVSMIGMAFLALRLGSLDPQELLQATLQYAMVFSIITASIAIVVFSLWYYFGCGRPSYRVEKGVISIKNAFLLLAIAVVSQIVIMLFISGLQLLLPQAVEDYAQLMELAGLGEMRWDVFLYVGILGPIVEELIFRGVTFYIARRFTANFWLANALQALAFGILHLNLVQGLYAFLGGLVFGWVYYRFRSLYAAIWIHICFNCLGLAVAWITAGLLPS